MFCLYICNLYAKDAVFVLQSLWVKKTCVLLLFDEYYLRIIKKFVFFARIIVFRTNLCRKIDPLLFQLTSQSQTCILCRKKLSVIPWVRNYLCLTSNRAWGQNMSIFFPWGDQITKSLHYSRDFDPQAIDLMGTRASACFWSPREIIITSFLIASKISLNHPHRYMFFFKWHVTLRNTRRKGISWSKKRKMKELSVKVIWWNESSAHSEKLNL